MESLVLYHSLSARSFRPLWTLEALGLPYQLKVLPFPPRAHDRSYLDVNPLGTVPALAGDGFLMTESVAMCQYLVERARALAPGSTPGLAVVANEPDFPDYLNFLHYGEATLSFPQTLILRYGRFEPAERRLPQIVQDYEKWFLSRTRLVAARLTDRAYLCADRLTLADISVGYALMLAEYLGLLQKTATPLQDYWQRLSHEPSFQSAREAELKAAQQQGVSLTPAPLIMP